ncbi:MAG: tetratricopeptide repeat protein [Thermoguttaceae bacterium]
MLHFVVAPLAKLRSLIFSWAIVLCCLTTTVAQTNLQHPLFDSGQQMQGQSQQQGQQRQLQQLQQEQQEPVNTQFPYDVPLSLMKRKPIAASSLLLQLFEATRTSQLEIKNLQERKDSFLRLLEMEVQTDAVEDAKKTIDCLLTSYTQLTNPFEQDKLLQQIARLQGLLGMSDDAQKTAKGINERRNRLKTQFDIVLIPLIVESERYILGYYVGHMEPPTLEEMRLHDKTTFEKYGSQLYEILEKAKREKDYSIQSQVGCCLGVMELGVENDDKAFELIDESLKATQKLEKQIARQMSRANIKMNSICIVQRKGLKAAIEFAESLEQTEQKSIAYMGICQGLLVFDKLEDCLSLYPRILELSEVPELAESSESSELSEKARFIEHYLFLLVHYYVTKSTSQAFLDTIRDWNIDPQIRIKFMFLASLLRLQRKQFEDVELFLKEMESCEERNQVLQNLAIMLNEERQFDRAIAVAEQMDNENVKREAFRNIALSLLFVGEDQKSRELQERTLLEHEKETIVLLEKSLEEALKDNDVQIRLMSLSKILGQQLQQFDLFGARKTLLAIRDTAKERTDDYERLQTLIQTIRGLHKFGLREEAIAELQSVIEQVEKLTELQRIDILAKLADAQLGMDEEEAGKQTLKRLVQLIEMNEKVAKQILAIIEFAGVMLRLDDFQGAIEMIQEGQARVAQLETAEERSGAFLTLSRALLQIETKKAAASLQP